MSRITTLIIALFLVSCSDNPEKMLTHLNGYWEISKAEMNDGIEKDYNFNASIDYIMVNDSLKGFRKKLSPNFDGSFTTSQDAEAIEVKIENDSLNLYYSTPYAKWKETVLEANETHLKIVNFKKDVYLYKRYVPLDL
ncbi:lipocalin family protein [Paucihalobacter sp.]|uniref:lipocalin family protein n=1 Tax=Paucihalobacter sp. TaxID=2850405 RepID=UPI002FE03632